MNRVLSWLTSTLCAAALVILLQQFARSPSGIPAYQEIPWEPMTMDPHAAAADIKAMRAQYGSVLNGSSLNEQEISEAEFQVALSKLKNDR